ncbi:hypothetical protein EN788_59720, partial [Mesorhizobium sp. M2D.F.Ca.ET.145.01.1.1]
VIAAAALGLCILVFALAKSFQGNYPWLGFVAAFAEAAMTLVRRNAESFACASASNRTGARA